ncbi:MULTISPECIES: Cfr10I/Bse634I family restriction endonuclease [unclassified Citrobacter]|uniref:Cfr10I/Bse634I family restriction endonuclease n=1 Tax=unclassified Citrobacter TaxID=2644389 RepID=UPI00187E72EF|nr:Cfr10I/Bse634I family restriction endonuclease [Citrobacter sp. BDA59-3]QOV69349.1 Cfr10I/Bse634I family restriction endonuclease [Citrobacter sp. BDA59-3]
MEIVSGRALGGKTLTINSANAFIAYSARVDVSEMHFSDVLTGLKHFVNNAASEKGGSVSDNSFNKCNGDWYEWLIAIQSIVFFLNNNTNRLLIKMPNASSFDVISMYKEYLSGFIYDLREKLKVNDVNLITSNPDFSIIEIGEARAYYEEYLSGISFYNLDLSTLSKLDNLYKQFVNYAELDSIVSFLSVKTTFRPDRRLQLAHEGSLMKALYTHLQTRTWNINPRGVKYYAAATSIGPADKIGLKTVATHSITDVKSLPQSAVDELFKINSISDVNTCMTHILFS